MIHEPVQSWSIDKKIPILALIAFGIQTLYFTALFTTKSNKIDEHDKRLERLEGVDVHTLENVQDFNRRAAMRQQQLDEHAAKLLKMEGIDDSLISTNTALLQQVSRIDERTQQLAAAIQELRNDLRRQNGAPNPGGR